MKSLKMLLMAALTILSVAVVAQDAAKHKIKMPALQPVKMKYSCPMHPEVTSDKPGKCSKCGMDLVLAKKEKMKMYAIKIYTCPMHPDVKSEKPGKCPKCGMVLVEKKEDHAKSQR